jgi:hypothetical protein
MGLTAIHLTSASTTGQPVLVVTLLAASVGALTVLALATAALALRRSVSYGLVTAALTTLAVRTAVAWLTIANLLSTQLHHLLEHGLDVIMASLVIGAVYYARTVQPPSTDEGSASE